MAEVGADDEVWAGVHFGRSRCHTPEACVWGTITVILTLSLPPQGCVLRAKHVPLALRERLWPKDSVAKATPVLLVIATVATTLKEQSCTLANGSAART